MKKDLNVLVYFKLDRAVFQKNKDINHRIIYAARKLRKAPLQLQFKAGAAVRGDQISPGFILSCLETSRTDCEQPVPLLSCPYGEKVPRGIQSPLSVLVPKAMSSPASPGCSDSLQRATASGPNHLGGPLMNLLLPNEKPQVFNKSRCCIPECSQSSGESLPY